MPESLAMLISAFNEETVLGFSLFDWRVVAYIWLEFKRELKRIYGFDSNFLMSDFQLVNNKLWYSL